MTTDQHIEGAQNIAAELHMSLTKFKRLSKELQAQGVIFRDKKGRAKRPYLWTWLSLLQRYKIISAQMKKD